MLYRVMYRINETVKQWEHAIRQPHNYSARFRNPYAEIAHWNNGHSAAILHYFGKFFDAVDVPTMLSNARTNDWPAHELILALQVHLAPRIIHVAGFSKNPCKSAETYQQVVLTL